MPQPGFGPVGAFLCGCGGRRRVRRKAADWEVTEDLSVEESAEYGIMEGKEIPLKNPDRE